MKLVASLSQKKGMENALFTLIGMSQKHYNLVEVGGAAGSCLISMEQNMVPGGNRLR
jgi:hypothetical protein